MRGSAADIPIDLEAYSRSSRARRTRQRSCASATRAEETTMPMPTSTASSSTTRKPATGGRSSSSTSSRATRGAGICRCASSPGATGASPSTRAGTRPSDVPDDPAAYSQQRAVDDIKGVLDHLGIARAHVCGLSMGGYATLLFGLTYPERALLPRRRGLRLRQRRHRRERSGRTPSSSRGASRPRAWRRSPSSTAGADARAVHRQGPAGLAGVPRPVRRQLRRGHALTMRGVQMKRPSVFDLGEQMERLEVPTLVMTGRRGRALPRARVFMKRKIPDGRARGPPEVRARDQPRGARGLQPRRARLPHGRRRRAAGRAATPRRWRSRRSCRRPSGGSARIGSGARVRSREASWGRRGAAADHRRLRSDHPGRRSHSPGAVSSSCGAGRAHRAPPPAPRLPRSVTVRRRCPAAPLEVGTSTATGGMG